jgi:hypothetical protein
MEWRIRVPRKLVTLVLGVLLAAAAHGACAWRQWTWTNSTGPGARSGHSLVVYKSQLIVFGGRTNDASKPHVPKTYEIHQVKGTLEFASYEDKVARPSDDKEVRVGVFLNDVWSYDISALIWFSPHTASIDTNAVH